MTVFGGHPVLSANFVRTSSVSLFTLTQCRALIVDHKKAFSDSQFQLFCKILYGDRLYRCLLLASAVS